MLNVWFYTELQVDKALLFHDPLIRLKVKTFDRDRVIKKGYLNSLSFIFPFFLSILKWTPCYFVFICSSISFNSLYMYSEKITLSWVEIKIKILKSKDFSLLNTLRWHRNMLINVKQSAIVGTLTFMNRIKFMLSWVEWNKFYNQLYACV